MNAGENIKCVPSRNERHIRVVMFRSAILFFVPLAPIFLVAGSLPKFGLLALAAFGSSAVGALLGFLFGIPRSADADQSIKPLNENSRQESSERPRTLRDNTNLEQVSDWLVKVLIGASLVQVDKIREGICTFSTLVGADLSIEAKEPFALFLIFYYCVLGFLSSYLMTKLFMPSALTQAQNDVEQILEEKFTKLNSRIEVSERREKAFRHVMRADELIRDKRFEEAESQCREALRLDLDNVLAHIVLGKIFKRESKLDDAIEELNQALAISPSNGRALYNRACYRILSSPQSKSDALKDLAEAIKYQPEYSKYALRDEDFKALWNDPEFVAIVGNGT